MEFRLLGPVQGWIGDQPVDLGVRKQRFVLAVLALEANRLVTTDRLVDLIWPDGPPATARAAVHTYISRLRAILADARAARYGVEVRSDRSGYLLACDPARVDAHRFRDLLARAGAGADDESRVALLDQALALWHGPALAGTAQEQASLRLGHHLEEARLTAIEDRVDALLRLGRHRQVVDELTGLVSEHPGRHRFSAQLMLALHRGDRPADALAAYRDARRRIADEFGLDPPPQLRRLAQAILRNEPAAVATPVPEPPPLPKPAQLPADLHSFTGRGDELAELLAGNPAGVWAIDGMAGVGKTALAVHAAHRLLGSFPDGQLFVGLHGHAEGLEPVRPADALDRMLRALGVAGDQIPPGTEDRAALFRSRLAGRRVLVVLDDAAGEAQVRPLLPASAGCLVLITSRRSLTGLDDVRPIRLDVLPRDDAVDLFVTVAGRADASASDVVELCGRLPLAIRIAAGRLRARPSWTVAHLVERLHDERHRLAELEVGQRSVAAAFRLSYDQLCDRRRHLFRVLGLHPGADFDAYAAAALAGTTVREAGRDLEELVDVHLLQQRGPDRYAFHDLIRACAIERAEHEEPDPRPPLRRLLDHYLHSASVAMDLFAPHERHRRPEVAAPSTPTPDLSDAAAATAWLETELANLLAIAHHAAAHGWPAHTWDLSATLFRFLDTRGHYLAGAALHRKARDCARRRDDRTGEGRALVDLGTACRRLTRHVEAIKHYRAAVDLFRDTGHAEWEARALHNLGSLYQRYGRYAESADHCRRALAVFRTVGDENGQAHTLKTLGDTYKYLGRYAEALECGKEALDLHLRTGNQLSEAHALHCLGLIYQHLGRYAEALDHYERAAALFRATGDPAHAQALSDLGMAHLGLGHHAEALDQCHRAIVLSRAIHDRNAELEAGRNLGEALRVVGRPGEGLGHLRAALALARELDQPHDVGRAHDALARLHDDLGEPDVAAAHREEALAIFTELGAPHTEEVARRGHAGEAATSERTCSGGAQRQR